MAIHYGVFAVISKGDHKFLFVSDKESLHLMVEEVNRWVCDPDLDFDADDREYMLPQIAAAIKNANWK